MSDKSAGEKYTEAIGILLGAAREANETMFRPLLRVINLYSGGMVCLTYNDGTVILTSANAFPFGIGHFLDLRDALPPVKIVRRRDSSDGHISLTKGIDIGDNPSIAEYKSKCSEAWRTI